MQLLLCPMNLMLLVIAATATPPPSYARPPNEDKDPPRYRYEYEIGNVDGNEGQGKTEARLGGSTSGRYYVNSEKSATDVEYYADEWGYHPLVKYHAANDHSSAATHLALGEHVVKSLLNGSQVGEEVELPLLKARQDQANRQPSARRRPAQLVQPYTPVSSEITASPGGNVLSTTVEKETIDDTFDLHSPPNYNSQRSTVRTLGFRDGVSSASNYQQNFDNYVTPPRASLESVGESEQSVNVGERYYQQDNAAAIVEPTLTLDSRVPPSIHQRYPSTLGSPSSRSANYKEQRANGREDPDDSYPAVFDDVLHVENAGSFGRRLKQGMSPIADRSLVKTKTQPKFALGNLRPYENLTRKSLAHISGTVDEVDNGGPSTYSAYPVTSTTPRTMSATHSTSNPMWNLHNLRNTVGPELSSNDHKNTINDLRQRDSTASGIYDAIFTKIFPNGDRTNEIGENVNSLVAGNSKLLHFDSKENDTGSIRDNENIGIQGPLDYGKSFDHQLYVNLRQSLDTQIRDSSNAQSSVPASTYSSQPIVVAELSNDKPDKGIEYRAVFPCNNEERSTVLPSITITFTPTFREDSNVLLVTPRHQTSQNHITTSSVILNPIQAGVSLVNADQTESIGTENQMGGGTPAPVNEIIEGDGQVVAIKTFPTRHGNELGKIVTEETGSEFYETINPAFGQSTSSEDTGSQGDSPSGMPLATGNAEDQQIEIQKSVEIYHHAPVQEIHYPPQVITQVADMNNLQAGAIKQQRVDLVESLHHRSATKEAQEIRSINAHSTNPKNVKQLPNPLQSYNGVDPVSRQTNSTHTALESIRGVLFTGGSAYRGNVARQGNESIDYPIAPNERLSTVLSEQDDDPRIIKFIRDNVPEAENIAAHVPRTTVKLYPAFVRANDSRPPNEWQRQVLREHQDQLKSNVAEQGKKMQSQLQRILSESESVQRYFSDAEWSKLRAQQQRQPGRSHETSGSYQVHEEHEQDRQSGGNYQVQENIDEPRVPQSQQQHSIVVPRAQSHDAPSVSNLQENLSNAVQDRPTTTQPVPQNPAGASSGGTITPPAGPVPQPYIVEVPRMVEKKVPFPVEKIVEKKVPYPVEKIIEKKIPVPQPYPVHIQVPVDRVVEKQVQILQPYPVHVEKVVEKIVEKIVQKKVPYPVQRLVPQPYPVHILQPYPVETIVEKPVHIPVTVEKIVEKRVHVPQPYSVQVPIKVPYPVEVTKYVGNMVQQVPYGVRYGVSYQQIMKPQSSKGLYGSPGSMSVPLYGVSLVSNSNHDRERPSLSQNVQGYNYDKPAKPFISGEAELADSDQQTSNGWEQFAHGKSSSSLDDNSQLHQAFAKKSYHSHVSKLPSLTYPLRNYSGSNRRHASYRQSAGPLSEQSLTKSDYLGPVPLFKQIPQHQVMRSRSSAYQEQQTALKQQHSTAVTRSPSSVTVPTPSRRARQPDDSSHYKTGSGSFRQSKMEYGFKPPMVPSVQYDEKTAAKVDN